MRRTLLLGVFVGLVLGGCKKNDNPADDSFTGTMVVSTYSTGNVKTSPVYFSFDSKDTVLVSQPWDILLTNTLMSVDPSIPPIKYPVIAFNRTRSVSGKIIDGVSYDSVDPSTVTALQQDINDTTLVIGVQCLNYDGTTHRLNPYPNRTFVVKTPTGKRVKFKVVSYYNPQGVSGYVTFDYAIK